MNNLWHASEVLAAMDGQLDAPAQAQKWTASGVSIDTRELCPHDLFIAIKGKRHNGHDFVAEAFKKGAAAVIVERTQNLSDREVKVKDSHQALISLAGAARARTSAKIAAVTGSVGKTSVKDGLALALAADDSAIHCAAKSLNNHWGVPLALARMPAASDFGIFEIGMNHAGEIAPLARLTRPDIAIITQIAEAHLAFFKNIDGIAAAKAEIFDGLKQEGGAVLPRDSAFYDFLSDHARQKGAGRIVSFGADARSDIQLVDISMTENGADVRARAFDMDLAFHLFMPARALALNALAILGAVHLMGGDMARAASRLGQYRPRSGRGTRASLHIHGANIILIDDSYNANPASMRAALEILDNMPAPAPARRIVVLGDMHELGKEAVNLHKALADPVQKTADLVFACGEKMKYLYDLLPEGLHGGYALTSDRLYPILQKKLHGDVREGDIVMVKASHAAGLDRIIAALKDKL